MGAFGGYALEEEISRIRQLISRVKAGLDGLDGTNVRASTKQSQRSATTVPLPSACPKPAAYRSTCARSGTGDRRPTGAPLSWRRGAGLTQPVGDSASLPS